MRGPLRVYRPPVAHGRTAAAALLAVTVLAACAPSGSTSQTGPASCPVELRAGEVPGTTADTVGRLVPEVAPDAAAVCRYGPVEGGAAQLAGERDLGDGLGAVPDDLALPRAFAGAEPDCDDAGPGRPHLLRLRYAEGTVWVRSDVPDGGCGGTRSAAFTSPVATGGLLAAAYDTRAWAPPPLPDAALRCTADRTGRAGQETALVPGDPRELVLCRVGADGVVRRDATQAQRDAVLDALDDPVAEPSDALCRQAPGERYELVARYARGRAVLVRWSPGCRPDVDNGSLAAQLAPAGVRALRAAVDEALVGS